MSEKLKKEIQILRNENFKLRNSFAYQYYYTLTSIGELSKQQMFFATKEQHEKSILNDIHNHGLKNDWLLKIVYKLEKSKLFRLLFNDIYKIIKKGCKNDRNVD